MAAAAQATMVGTRQPISVNGVEAALPSQIRVESGEDTPDDPHSDENGGEKKPYDPKTFFGSGSRPLAAFKIVAPATNWRLKGLRRLFQQPVRIGLAISSMRAVAPCRAM